MKIILYGDTDIEGTGAWCYAEAIKSQGHELFVYKNDCFLEMYSRSLFWKILRKLNHRSVLKIHRQEHFTGLLTMAETTLPDMIIILKGIHIGKEDIRTLKNFARFVVNINHDDFFSHNKNIISRRQFAALPYYDHIFTTRQVNVGEIKPYNSHVEFFMFAYYPGIHTVPLMTEGEKTKYSTDVLFIGTYEKHRAKMLEKLMASCRFNLAIYGIGWHRLATSSIIRKYVKSHSGIWMHEMAKAIAAAKITVGFLRKENRDEYTQRSLEIPACGGLLLAERSGFHQHLFNEDKEAVFFDADNVDELKEKIGYLLANQNTANQIRASGHKKITNGNFTYADRIHQLIERYNEFHR